MSHFTVLVIGEDIEGQLDAYDENKEVLEYCEKELTEEEMKGMLEYYNKEIENENKKFKDFETCYAIKGRNWNSNRWRKDTDGIWREYSRYNPKSKWDWYQKGGRWAGFFKLKNNVNLNDTPNFSWGWEEEDKQRIIAERRVDSALKGQIDFEGMENDAEESALKIWNKIAGFFGGEIPKISIWESYVKRIESKQLDIEEARILYHNQEPIKKLRESKDDEISWIEFDEFQVTKEEYIKKARDNAIECFAIVKEGVWYEKGRMGWFGFSFDEKPEKEWAKEFRDILNSVSDDTLFTMVDCHI